MNEDIVINPKQEEFIKLRAEGNSYDSISRQINISKPTLISWSKKFKIDLHNLSEIKRESVREQFAISKLNRLEVLSEQLKKARLQLKERDYSDIPTVQLLNIIIRIEERLANEESDGIIFKEEYEDSFLFSEMKTDAWKG